MLPFTYSCLSGISSFIHTYNDVLLGTFSDFKDNLFVSYYNLAIFTSIKYRFV